MNKDDLVYKQYISNLKSLKEKDITYDDISKKFYSYKKEENALMCFAIVQLFNLILMALATTTQDRFIKYTMFLFVGIIIFLISSLLLTPLLCYLSKEDNAAEVKFKVDSLLSNTIDEEFEFKNFLKIKKVVKIEKGDIVLFNRFITEIIKEKNKEKSKIKQESK